MIKKYHECDVCKEVKVTSKDEKAGYRFVGVRISNEDTQYFNTSTYTNDKQFSGVYLCPACLEELNLKFTGKKVENTSEADDTNYELIKLLSQLIAEEIGFEY